MRQAKVSLFPGAMKSIAWAVTITVFSGGLSHSLAATSIPQGLDASWTVVASTGTPDDEVSQDRYNLHDDFIEFDSNASFEGKDTIWFRYNVAVPEGFFVKEIIEIDNNNMITVVDDPEQFGGFKLNARFRDNGADEQVIVTLIELNSFTGEIRELIKFDSDDFESKTVDTKGFKRASADCIFEGEKPADAGSFNQTLSALGFDFSFASGRAYFVKAELVRNTAGGNPALSTIEITRDLASCGI